MEINLFNYDTILGKCVNGVSEHAQSPFERGECDSLNTLQIDLITSYHSITENGDISISTSLPKFPTKANIIYERLTPSAVMGLRNKYAFRDMSEEEYLDRFLNGLERMSASEIWEELKALSGNKTPCIVCFEKWDKFCHRHIVADWLGTKLDLKFDERLNITGKKKLKFNKALYLYEEEK